LLAGIRSRLTYANVMATIAVFMALGGGAYAAFSLPKDSVRSKNIVDGQVKPVDLAVHKGKEQAFMSRFRVPFTFDVPTSFGPILGFTSDLATATEQNAVMVSPDKDLVAKDMTVFFNNLNNTQRRLTLRVAGQDTGLTCAIALNTTGPASCSSPPGTEVPIPAGSQLAWKADRPPINNGNAAETFVSASFVLAKP
jgi:hypothetical protein